MPATPVISDVSAYIRQQVAEPYFDFSDEMDTYYSVNNKQTMNFSLLRRYLTGSATFRMRMTNFLQNILIVADTHPALGSTEGSRYRNLMLYEDTLMESAFGTYRALIEKITHTQEMAEFLTYKRSTVGAPDQNYARETLQLHTTGLFIYDSNGKITDRPAYKDPEDIAELAKIYTGLAYPEYDWTNNTIVRGYATINEIRRGSYTNRFDKVAEGEKTWVGLATGRGFGLVSEPWRHDWSAVTLSYGTVASGQAQYDALNAQSNVSDWLTAENLQFNRISAELDLRFAYRDPVDNMLVIGKHLAAQMIARIVTSDFSGSYFRRVYNAYETGTYTLPDGTNIGSGSVSDLLAMYCAVLLDPEAVTVVESDRGVTWGRFKTDLNCYIGAIRPLVAASEIGAAKAYSRCPAWESVSGLLTWLPYRQGSTFGHGEPLYTAPGTVFEQQKILSSELSTVTDDMVRKYVQAIRTVATAMTSTQIQNAQGALNLDLARFIAVADDTSALINILDAEFTQGRMRNDTRQKLITIISREPNDGTKRFERFKNAWMATVISPEFMISR